MIMRMVIVVAERETRATAAAESDGDAEKVGQLTFELRVQLYKYNSGFRNDPKSVIFDGVLLIKTKWLAQQNVGNVSAMFVFAMDTRCDSLAIGVF